MHEADAVVVGGAPDTRVRCHRQVQISGDLERGALRELRIPGDVEGHLEAEHVAGTGDAPLHEIPELRLRGPLPGALLDVAVGEHEAPRDLEERVQRRVGVLHRLQAVRPVDRRSDAGVDGLDG